MSQDPARLARETLSSVGYFDTYRSDPRVDLEALLGRYRIEWHQRPFLELAGALVAFNGEHHIVTNARDGWGRQRFSAAHELKHFLADRGGKSMFLCGPGCQTAAERAANIFARELLMPAEAVRWLYWRGIQSPGSMARVLGVSGRAAPIRFSEIGLGSQRAA